MDNPKYGIRLNQLKAMHKFSKLSLSGMHKAFFKSYKFTKLAEGSVMEHAKECNLNLSFKSYRNLAKRFYTEHGFYCNPADLSTATRTKIWKHFSKQIKCCPAILNAECWDELVCCNVSLIPYGIKPISITSDMFGRYAYEPTNELLYLIHLVRTIRNNLLKL